MPTITVNETQLTYIEVGQGSPVVFVHGSLGDYRSWAFQMDSFAPHYRTIAYSRRYHYPNSWSGDGLDYSTSLHADDLAAFIADLQLGRAHIVASSYGAYTALVLAVRHPERVRTLVMGEPPILPWLEQIPGGAELYASFLADTVWQAKGAFQNGELEEGVRIFIDGVIGKGTFDELPPPVRANLMENALGLKAETAAPGSFSALTREDVYQITVPTLLLTGEWSPRMFHLITDELERCLPKSERAMISGTSHGMATGNPQLFNETVLTFLARHA